MSSPVERDTVATRVIRFLSNRTRHICILVALPRLQDVFRVDLHLCCDFEAVLGIDPTVIGVVSILLADGVRIEGIMNHSRHTTVVDSKFSGR
jgi:hypothetical protein